MSGSNITAEAAIRSISQYTTATQIGNAYIHGEDGLTMEDAIAMGMNTAKGSDAYLAAEAMQKRMESGKKISPYAVGRMVMESQSETAKKAVEYEQAPKHKGILSLIQKVKTATHKDNESVSLGTVSADTAQKIHTITGIDVSGWAVEIEARQLAHIQKNHGANGSADHSMTNPDDVAKMGYILDSADEIAEGGFSTAYSNFINGKNRFAKTVLYQKDIGGRYYYVVEAVPDTKKKTLQIVSAYINQHKKIEGSHLIDAKSPDVTSKNVGVKPSKVNIAERNASVNYFSEQGGDGTSSVAVGDTSLGEGGLRGVGDAAPYGSATVPMSEAQVMERALQDTANGKAVATSRDVESIIDELGDEVALRRLYNATQLERPTGMVEIEGRKVDAGAYVDAYEQSLPDDPAALRQVITRLEQENTAEVIKAQEEGTLEEPTSRRLKINLQLFAANRKWDLLQLDAGEDGKKARKFYENRLKGNDVLHNEELAELLAGRSETYNPIGNQKTLDRANSRLRDAKYQAKLLKRIGRYNANDIFSAVDIAASTVLIKDAYNEGNYDVMMDLIVGLSRKGTVLGRAVQAFSMMARMTPEGTLKAATRTLRAEADYVIGDGANEGLDVLADDIAGALDKLARLKGNNNPSGTSPYTGEARAVGDARPYGEETLTREQIEKMQALTPGKKVSFYDLTDEQIKAFAPLEDRLYRELKNKSPFIRRCFGEWRVNDQTPITIATREGSERGIQKNKDTGWDIQVSGKVFSETNHHYNKAAKAARAYLPYINDVVENAVLLDTQTLSDNKSENSLAYHIFYAIADIGDGPALLKLQIEEMYNSSAKGIARRAYKLLNIENRPIGAKGSQNNAASPVTLSTGNITIADLIQIVKQKDSTYNPKTLVGVMADDLAAVEGTYLTREDIEKNLEKIIREATDVPEQVKRYVLKKIRKEDGGLAQRLYELHQKGHLNADATRRAMEQALELPTLTDEDVKTLVDMTTRVQELAEDPSPTPNVCLLYLQVFVGLSKNIQIYSENVYLSQTFPDNL